MNKSINKLKGLLVLILFVALMKLAIESVLRHFETISTDAVKMVTISAWGLIAFTSLMFLKNWLVTYRDNKQNEQIFYPSYDIHLLKTKNKRDSHTEKIIGDFKDFLWHFYVVLPKDSTIEEYQNEEGNIKEAKLDDIRGPYCPNDECKMVQKKTYLGKYKFRCPYCNYRNKTKENDITLINDLKRIFDSKIEKEGAPEQMYKEKFTMRKLQ